MLGFLHGSNTACYCNTAWSAVKNYAKMQGTFGDYSISQ